MYLSNHFETQILNTMRGTTLTAPSKMYLALFITDPTDTGAAGTEVAYKLYQRKEITFSEPAPVSGGIGIQNDTQITFPKSDSDAGTAAYIAIMDSLVGGNVWVHGRLTDPIPIITGTAPVFTPGDINFNFSNDLSKSYKTKFLNVLRGQNVDGFQLHVSLYNGNPDSGGSELSGANYSRVPLTMSAPSEASSGQMTIENSVQASFNRPSTAWGTWDYTALFNALSGGEAVWLQQKTPSWEMRPGRMPIIEQGALKIAVN